MVAVLPDSTHRVNMGEYSKRYDDIKRDIMDYDFLVKPQRFLRFYSRSYRCIHSNQIINIPVHRHGDIAAAVVYAVVGDAILWEVGRIAGFFPGGHRVPTSERRSALNLAFSSSIFICSKSANTQHARSFFSRFLICDFSSPPQFSDDDTG